MYNEEEFIHRVAAHATQLKTINGAPWPKDPLERWILAWLELKADKNYLWPRWAVANEAAAATRAYLANVF